MSVSDALHATYQVLREKCALLVGREYVLDVKGYGRGGGDYAKFVIKENDFYLKNYEPIMFQNCLWYQVDNIYWGQGYHTGLYYNGESRLIAVNDTLVSNSDIVKEYAYDGV